VDAPRESFAPLPRADESEVALLCAVLTNPAVAPDVVHLVEPVDFHHFGRGALWSVIVGLTNAGIAPDAVLVRDEVRRLALTNTAELADLAKTYAASAFVGSNATAYAKVVREKAMLRRLIVASQAVTNAAMDGASLDEVLADAREKVLAVEEQRATPVETLATVLEETIAEIEGTTDTQAVTTGILSLDELAGPIEAGQFILVGARPSMGKTAFALNVAHAVAEQYGPVLFLSLEMPAKRLARRLVCSVSGVNLESMKPGRMVRDEQRAAIKAAAASLAPLRLLIDDASSPTVDAIRARVKRHVERDGIRLVVIDYLGLVREPAGRTINNRENVVGAISRALKATAKDFAVPMLALSQLNRVSDQLNRAAVTAEDTKPPTLSDLRDSGSLEQDADSVWFIHRPGYYTKRPGDQGIGEVHIAKNRDGQTGKVVLDWSGAAQRFSDARHA
jgi:replicative DNA helicase